MNIPAWLNRETIQMVLIVLVTAGFHYYFITNRLGNSSADENSNNSSGDDESIIPEQETAQAWAFWYLKITSNSESSKSEFMQET